MSDFWGVLLVAYIFIFKFRCLPSVKSLKAQLAWPPHKATKLPQYLGFACLILGKSSKNILPNGGLIVMNPMVQSKKSPTKQIQDTWPQLFPAMPPKSHLPKVQTSEDEAPCPEAIYMAKTHRSPPAKRISAKIFVAGMQE